MSQDLEKIKKSNADLWEQFENLSKELGVENADFEEKLSKVNKKNEGKIADLQKEIDYIKKIIRFCLKIKKNYGITSYPLGGHGKKNIKKEK